ncbi:hypothetical protein RB195_000173 [Necator americanus]|uniref:Uncharacterized protein n=1 Tax=Necator americanus TaxID=51031 RepID=A0ABR1D8B7_NECAM
MHPGKSTVGSILKFANNIQQRAELLGFLKDTPGYAYKADMVTLTCSKSMNQDSYNELNADPNPCRPPRAAQGLILIRSQILSAPMAKSSNSARALSTLLGSEQNLNDDPVMYLARYRHHMLKGKG